MKASVTRLTSRSSQAGCGPALTARKIRASSESRGATRPLGQGAYHLALRLAGDLADLVERVQDRANGLADRLLDVGDLALGAVGAHQLAGATEVAARHGREEVVLDLVVESAVQPVGQGTRADVARGQDLPLQEGGLG